MQKIEFRKLMPWVHARCLAYGFICTGASETPWSREYYYLTDANRPCRDLKDYSTRYGIPSSFELTVRLPVLSDESFRKDSLRLYGRRRIAWYVMEAARERQPYYIHTCVIKENDSCRLDLRLSTVRVFIENYLGRLGLLVPRTERSCVEPAPIRFLRQFPEGKILRKEINSAGLFPQVRKAAHSAASCAT